MNSGNDNAIKNASLALALLQQQVTQLKKEIPNLMNINSIDQISWQKRENTEKKLWAIFIYGEYPLRKTLNKLAVYTRKKIGNYSFYLNEYKPVNEKLCELLGVKTPPRHIDVEERVNILVDVYEDHCSESEMLELYKNYALNDLLTDYVKECVEKINKNPQEYAKNNNPIKSSFHDALEAVDLLFSCINQVEKLYPGKTISLRAMEVVKPDEKVEKPPINFGEDVLAACEFPNSIFAEDIRNISADFYPGNIYDKTIVNISSVLEEFYFQPDAWVARKNELSPFVLSKNPPPYVVEMVKQIHSSYIFGNWLAVIALSRSLLEYAIIDRKNHMSRVHGKQVDVCEPKTHNGKIKGQNKSLDELIRISGEIFGNIKDDMFYVKNQGNEIMHPPADSYRGSEKIENNRKKRIPILKEMRALVPSKKNTAKTCIGKITRIITTLYDEETPLRFKS